MNQAVWHTDEVPKVYLMALCVWREARGTSQDAKRAVAHAIKNRAVKPSWWGNGFVDVILKPLQFSSFNVGDPNATKFPAQADPIFLNILDIVARVLVDDEDLTDGATHYHDRSVFPDWAAKMKRCAEVGPFTFYKEA